ncbi:M48 family metallopeptidase [Sphaerotilus sp.]|uniref:M48 metallopeptidase family protein n=1 Tax=Sphaerotilus sp. TaxID=2093942 RepID=UPI002ACD4564|nr:M48 family metallopeptidase [Sphaerotilus sp.]MDZ7857733.1 M48 family metallopeptidase [Sphaerotilus sp.]
MKALVPALLARWQPVLGVAASAWGIKRMKTKWGSCTPASGRIWLNLDLARQRPACIEYVVVHELAHLIVRRHDAQLRALMDRVLPGWAALRAELNRGTLADEVWRE